MISNLLAASNGTLLVPLALVIAATVLVKGVFSLHRSRSQDRKEFLDVWGRDNPDDLWVEVAIRHMYGTYLPAAVIRMLRASPQAGRALLEISESWPLLEMDDETKDIRWRHKWHATASRRRWLWVCYWGLYLAIVGTSLINALMLVVDPQPNSLYWPYIVAGLMIGVGCLYKAEQLQTARRAVPRWLGLS